MRKDLYEDLYLQEEKHWWHISKRKVVSQMMKMFLRRRNSQILDIGCGAGKTMSMLSQFGEVFGIDVSNDALIFCKKRGFKNLKRADAAKTGFQNEFFDVITMLDVLEHIEEDETLREVKRIVKPGGIVIVTVPAFQWLWSSWDVVLKHKRRYTKGDLEALFAAKHGFRILRSSYMYSFLVLPAFIFRKIKSSQKKFYGSDFSNNKTLLNVFFTLLSDIERFFVLRGMLPFGTSLVLVCKR